MERGQWAYYSILENTMGVYVDRLMSHGWIFRGKRTKSCHLMADTPAELHAFARQLGLKPGWAHRRHDGGVHYDLVASKREEAVRLGAKEVKRPI